MTVVSPFPFHRAGTRPLRDSCAMHRATQRPCNMPWHVLRVALHDGAQFKHTRAHTATQNDAPLTANQKKKLRKKAKKASKAEADKEDGEETENVVTELQEETK